jgi:hypothetical protein
MDGRGLRFFRRQKLVERGVDSVSAGGKKVLQIK